MLRKLECKLVYHMGIQIYDQISIARKLSKVKLHRAFFAFVKLALKGTEIARNVAKVSVYACLFKGVHKSTFKFDFLKS